MTFFPPVNPNAAYIDDDTGAVVKPSDGNKGSGLQLPAIVTNIWSGKGMFAGNGGHSGGTEAKPPEYYGPGGNPDGSGQGQAQQRPSAPAAAPASSRNVDRSGAKGTQTGPAAANFYISVNLRNVPNEGPIFLN